MRLVIGVAGRIGAGKSLISEYLHERYGASQHRFSDALVGVAESLRIPPEREALQKLGEALRRCFDEDVLVKALRREIEQEGSSMAVVDGVRYPNEVEMLRGFERSLLIFVDAPAELRYERVRSRGEKGEASITFQEFKEADGRETERHLHLVRRMADEIVENKSAKEELYSRIDRVLRERGLAAL